MHALRSMRYLLTHSRVVTALTAAFVTLFILQIGLIVAGAQTRSDWPWVACLIGAVMMWPLGRALVRASEGYRPVTADEYERICQQPWTHRSRLTARVGDRVMLEPSFCRFMSRMKRSDHLLRPAHRVPAVYFATTDGGEVARRANGVHRHTTILVVDFDHHQPPAREHCYLRNTGDLAVTTAVPARVIHAATGDQP